MKTVRIYVGLTITIPDNAQLTPDKLTLPGGTPLVPLIAWWTPEYEELHEEDLAADGILYDHYDNEMKIEEIDEE